MPEFRVIQISDPHLARRLTSLTGNFHRASEYIDARRPDLVINSGDLAYDAQTNRDDLEFAKTLHDALPVFAANGEKSLPVLFRDRLRRRRTDRVRIIADVMI